MSNMATVSQAAKLLDLSPTTVRSLFRKGAFPTAEKAPQQDGGRIRIPLDEINAYAKRVHVIPRESPARDAKIRAVAEYLDLDPETVRIMTRQGVFPNAYKTGPKPNHPIRVPWSDVEDYRRKMPRVNQ